MNYEKCNTSLSLNKNIYFLVSSLSMQLKMKGIYCNQCDIIEKSALQLLNDYKQYLSKEQCKLLDSINLPNRLPKLK